MTDPRLLGSRQVLAALLPGVSLQETYLTEAEFRANHSKRRVTSSDIAFGTIFEGDSTYLWQRLPDGRIHQTEVLRKPITLTSREREILRSFEKTQRGLFTDRSSRAAETTLRMASFNAFSNILVSRYLRGHGAANFWTPNLIISELQALALRHYEGSPCTSGVIFTREPDVILSKIDRAIYAVEDIGKLKFDVGFFSHPPTYRYVDGKNAFYIVDNWQNVRGVLRLNNPSNFSHHSRAAFGHLEALFAIPVGRMFAAAVGNHGYVTVQSRNKLQLRWQYMSWSLTDQKLFIEILIARGLATETAADIVNCCLAVSDMRSGALLLILADGQERPPVIGVIGNDGVSFALQNAAKGKTISGAMGTNEILGILTSDGLTTIDSGGKIVGAGEIVDLKVADGDGIIGGGRTQAARAASQYGLAIKISEDGPISLFEREKLIIRFNR